MPQRHPLDELDFQGRALWRLPSVPVDYQHILRGRGYRAWKPVLSLLFIVVAFLGLQIFIGIVVGFIWVFTTGDIEAVSALETLDLSNPMVLILLFGMLGLLIPLSFLGVRLVHGIKGGYLSSVAGRFRWGWAAKVTAVVLPLWALYIGLAVLVFDDFTVAPPENWPVLLAVILILVPFQAAGEEYAFRGYLMQVVGSWFRSRWLALVVPAVMSALFFGLAHGSLDPFVLLDLALFAAVAVYLTWRTGGLEAAVVIHVVNNLVVFQPALFSGDIESSIIDEQTTAEPYMLIPSLVVYAIVVPLVVLLARRSNVQRMFEPVEIPAAMRKPLAPHPYQLGQGGMPPWQHSAPPQPYSQQNAPSERY